MRFVDNNKLLLVVIPVFLFLGFLAGSLFSEKPLNDPGGIWHDTVHKSPYKYRPNLNLSLEYMKGKEYGLCVGYAERAIKIAPDKAAAYLNAGSCYIQQKNWLGAYNMFFKLQKLKPNKISVQNLSGLAKLMGNKKVSELWAAKLKDAPELKMEYADGN